MERAPMTDTNPHDTLGLKSGPECQVKFEPRRLSSQLGICMQKYYAILYMQFKVYIT